MFEPNEQLDIQNLSGLIKTVVLAPTYIPRKFSEQFVIYNSQFYYYDTTNAAWKAGLITPVGVVDGGTGLTALTQGDLLYASATNTLAKLAKDTNSTRYLSNQGTSNNPSWNQVNLANGVTGNLPVANLNSGTSASSSTFWRGDGTWAAPSGGTSALTMIPWPAVPAVPGTNTQTTFSTNTTQSLYQFLLPFSITVNKISIKSGGTVTTAGTFDITIYSENGQTKEIAVTTASITTGDTIYSTSVSAVTLAAGVHWFAINPNGTANAQFYCYTQGTGAALANTVSLSTDVASEPVLMGTQTITAGTPATTFTPSSLTESILTTVGVIFRLDN